jgi:hypothetical protein
VSDALALVAAGALLAVGAERIGERERVAGIEPA